MQFNKLTLISGCSRVEITPMRGENVCMQPTEPEISVKVFISYSHEDKELHERLDNHLSTLKRSGEITIWRDQQILPGNNWSSQIKTRLKEADVILLLVSASFLASQYCWEEEV